MTSRSRSRRASDRGGPPPVARWQIGVGLVLLPLLGIACIVSANERLAETGSSIARIGRLPVGPSAAGNQAVAALTADPGFAAARAAEALRSAPVSAHLLSIVGAAALVRGDAGGADAAFRVAGTMGWRSAPVQRYFLMVGLTSNDMTVSAQRLDALLRTTKATDDDMAALARIEAEPEGRTVLASHLAARPNWLLTYSRSLLEPVEPAIRRNRLATMLAARSAGVTWNRDVLQRVLRRSMVDGDTVSASQARSLLT